MYTSIKSVDKFQVGQDPTAKAQTSPSTAGELGEGWQSCWPFPEFRRGHTALPTSAWSCVDNITGCYGSKAISQPWCTGSIKHSTDILTKGLWTGGSTALGAFSTLKEKKKKGWVEGGEKIPLTCPGSHWNSQRTWIHISSSQPQAKNWHRAFQLQNCLLGKSLFYWEWAEQAENIEGGDTAIPICLPIIMANAPFQAAQTAFTL